MANTAETVNATSLKLKPLRTVFLAVIIGALTISAAFGIWMLLFGGELGQLEYKILWTTLLIAAGSAICLVALSSFSRSPKILGVIAIVLALVATLISSIYYVWLGWEFYSQFSDEFNETVVKITGLSWLWAVIFAHAAIIMSLSIRTTLQKVLLAALFFSTLAIGVMVSVVAIFELYPEDWYYRVMWSLIILAVLLTIVVPVVASVAKAAPLPSRALLNELAGRAAVEGKSVDVLLKELLSK